MPTRIGNIKMGISQERCYKWKNIHKNGQKLWDKETRENADFPDYHNTCNMETFQEQNNSQKSCMSQEKFAQFQFQITNK